LRIDDGGNRMSGLLRLGAVIAALAANAASGPSALRIAGLVDGHPRTIAALRGTPHAIVVWKASCGPCVQELAHLNEIAARASNWRFVTLALDDAATVGHALPPEARIGEAWVASDEPTTVLAALNPSQPALPLTIAVDVHGRVCARRVGLLGSDILASWSAQCSR
jgi:hypothetical protein